MEIKKGLESWKKAKSIIPGGAQLLSKRAEQFLPEQWPSYYSKAKGVELWDLDGNKFIDMSTMGIGSCILGYADDDVNNAVKKCVDNGSMSTLNCYEEIELAELLLSLNKWAGMVRYAKTGGEAAAIAVRIARAYTGKEKVAFCGYHGWTDWYISSNLSDSKNLDELLLPGLKPNGVPKGLKDTAIPFNYNNIDELEEIVRKHDIGAIVMEPIRHHNPKDDFLKKVRKIADKVGAVLIFDEITSGWRTNVGGVYELLGVNPDIVVYAKAMSNGYPMSAIVGKKEIMNSAQDTFISSTYWTERVGLVAAIATIKKLIEKDVPSHLNRLGKIIGDGWSKLAEKHKLNIDVLYDYLPLITFSFNYENSNEIRTLFTQEMLKRGYLAGTSVYLCYAHNEEIVEKYFEKVDEVFELIAKGIENNNISSLLNGPVAHTGFKRLAD